MTIYDRVAKLEKSLKKTGRTVCCLQEEIGSGIRFGVSGEDDTAAEARSFDADVHPFLITGFGNGITLQQTDGASWNNGFSVNDISATVSASNPSSSVQAVLAVNPGGNASLQSLDSGNTNNSGLILTPITALLQVLTGSEIHNIYIDPTAFSPKGIFINSDDGIGTASQYKQSVGGWELKGETFRVFNASFTDEVLQINNAISSYSIGPLLADHITVANGTGITFNTSTGKYKFENIAEYADNAAALVGGLAIGEIYRTGDALKIVH